ncbi:MAG: 50S ribosomal protein L15 [Bacteroidetes bacterium]|nr:50S ribosomal protein L15 [Bacteroidota bacterium]HVZ40249.1 50S ribosomal protein L15 [Candidatus Kapabacteria bacterium]
MSNHLGLLHSPKGATKNKRRIGRGQGSGRGGTSTRGHKGHQSRSGFGQIPNFEGGQMAYIRRVPKFGFTNPFRVEYQTVNVSRLQELAESGAFVDGVVSPEALFALGVVSKRKVPVKILGNGELSAKLTVTAHKISAAARTKIEQAGGTVTTHE